MMKIAMVMLGAAGVVTGWGAAAQEMARADVGDPDDAIIVSGHYEEAPTTKSDVPLIEVPQAISSVTDETIGLRNVTRLSDVLTTVAGVSRSSTYGFYDAYTIRGFDAAYGSLFLDGLLNEAGGGGSTYEVFGLEAVEVLKGPAAVLYGAGSLGGLINMVSKRPGRDAAITARLSTGSYGLIEGALDVNAPLNADGSLAARGVALYRDVGSFVRFAGQNRVYLQPSLRWQPSERTDLTLLATYKRDRDNPFSPLNAYGTVLPNVNGRVPIDFSVNEGGDEKPIQNETRTTIGYLFDHRFSDAFAVSQNVRYMDRRTYWDRWMFAADVLDDELDADGNPIPGTGRTIGRYYYGPYHEVFRSILGDTRAKLDLATGVIEHKLMGGVDYRRTRSRYEGDGDFNAANFPLDLFDPDYSVPLNPEAAPYTGYSKGEQLGFYIQEHARIGERVTLTLNGRWDRARTGDELQTAFSPRVGATVELVPGVALYGSWARSFTPNFGSQIVLESDENGPTLLGQAPPERGRNEEVGAKFTLPAARLTGMLSAYRLTRSNVLQTDPAFPLFSRVSGRQRSRGVEAEAHWTPTPAFSADFAYSYIVARYAEDTSVPTGTPLPNVPRHNLAGYASYRVQGGALTGVGVIAGAQYNSARYTYDSGYAGTPYARDALLRLAPYTLVNLGLSYAMGPWLAQANVNNVFDERYYPDACCIQRVTPGQPRNFRLTLTYRR